MIGSTEQNPYVRSWDVPLYKGLIADFDEANVALRDPSFLATSRGEALYYASTLRVNDDNHRRVAEYRSVRSLTLLSVDVGQNPELAASSIDIDVFKFDLPELAVAAAAKGLDGVAVSGGESGWHFIVVDTGLLQHVATEYVLKRVSGF